MEDRHRAGSLWSALRVGVGTLRLHISSVISAHKPRGPWGHLQGSGLNGRLVPKSMAWPWDFHINAPPREFKGQKGERLPKSSRATHKSSVIPGWGLSARDEALPSCRLRAGRGGRCKAPCAGGWPRQRHSAFGSSP